jgi:3-dehydroquinate synthase
VSTTTIPVRTASANYNVHIGANLLPSIGTSIDQLLDGALASGKQKAFIITSSEIWRLHGKSLTSGFSTPPTVLEVPTGEQYKRLASVERLAEQLAEAGADRDSVLIAFAGGVLGDMTGFLAAAYMRGIRYVQVPTTLLSQVDSSIGGKTGVNLAAGKNLFGAFHHPLAVFADTAVLSTLPTTELRAGLQESVKAGIIRDRALFDYLEANSEAILSADIEHLAHVVAASVQVKAKVVAADEKESGERMLLNLGHTLGHAIESATKYKVLLHGEAVAWGMIAAIGIAERRAFVTTEEADRMGRVIRTYGPLKNFSANVGDLVALTAKDKKNRSGTRSFVLPIGIGNATVVRDISIAELTDATEAMMELRGDFHRGTQVPS